MTPQILKGEKLTLQLKEDSPANESKGGLRVLYYNMVLEETGETVGFVLLRVGYTTEVVRYNGHIGYGVESDWRGKGFASQGCIMLKEVAQSLGMDVIWITCTPDYWASRKTCERVGATLVEVVDVPLEIPSPSHERTRCRYRWILY